MKTVKEILHIIDKKSPFSAALDWDNVGLLVGDENQEVARIFVALDATEVAISTAASYGANLLVTHHPMLFSPVKRIVADDFIGRKIMSLVRYGISYIAMHTNYDIFGMADLAAGRLGMSHTAPLEPVAVSQYPKGTGDEKPDAGIGRVGGLPEPMSIDALCKKVKEDFGLSYVRFFGQRDRVVQWVAISPGSGKSEIKWAIEAGAEALITGDIDHHSGLDAVEQGLCIIDAGHYGIEHIFVDDMANYLRWALGGEVEVLTEAFAQPIQIL